MVTLTPREELILQRLRTGEEYPVTRLSEELGVSAVTIRADLRNLDAKGLVIRRHGKVLAASSPQTSVRDGTNAAQKEAIARVAATLVEENDCVMITNGSTCSLIPRYLFGMQGLKIVTNSTLILPYARANPHLHITLVGGEYRPQAEALVGPAAIEQIEDYHVSTTFFGTDGFTLEHGLTTGLVENSQVVQRMCAQATHRVLCVDSSKVGNRGFVRIMPVTEVDTIVTDSGFPKELNLQLTELGVEVIIAE
ncbi:MAG TPA: DeoR/GlpR family DNA-binding transcription regulator [Sphaerochaeta sp.]|nr:DeoR/GlpR family DNA-binding transcription regulator [Sphaerochaeta sp.]